MRKVECVVAVLQRLGRRYFSRLWAKLVLRRAAAAPLLCASVVIKLATCRLRASSFAPIEVFFEATAVHPVSLMALVVRGMGLERSKESLL